VKPLFEYKIVTIDHVRHLQDARLTLVDPAGTQRSVAIYQQYRTGNVIPEPHMISWMFETGKASGSSKLPTARLVSCTLKPMVLPHVPQKLRSTSLEDR
jgi:hypothetical protein